MGMMAADAGARSPSGWQRFTGTLRVTHPDPAWPVTARAVPQAQLSIGLEDLRLLFPAGRSWALLRARPGTRLSLIARLRGGALEVASRPRLRVLRPRALSHAAALGPQTVAVVLLSFQDVAQTLTAAQADSAMFTASNSVNAWWNEASWAKVSFSGTECGPYTIPYSSTGTCDYTAWSNAADSLASGQGVDLSRYAHVIYVTPPQASCNATESGIADARVEDLDFRRLPVAGVAQEMGHNLGLAHASAFTCTDASGAAVAMAAASSCASDEYGDPFDVTGLSVGSHPYHPNAYHLAQMGVLPAADLQMVYGSGDYVLGPSETSSGGIQLIGLPENDGSRNYLWLDFRQPSGVDDFTSGSPIVSGVGVRLGGDLADPPSQTQLYDMTPGSGGGFGDAMLTAGQSVTDPVSGDTISVTSVTSQAVSLHIAVANPGDHVPPSAPVLYSTDASWSSSGSTSVQLGWGAATDNVGVARYYVFRDGAQVGSVDGGTLQYTGPSARPGASYEPGSTDRPSRAAMSGAM